MVPDYHKAETEMELERYFDTVVQLIFIFVAKVPEDFSVAAVKTLLYLLGILKVDQLVVII